MTAEITKFEQLTSKEVAAITHGTNANKGRETIVKDLPAVNRAKKIRGGKQRGL